MSRLHVYAVFDHRTNELTAITSSIAGAGFAAIGHLGMQLTLPVGDPLTEEGLAASLSKSAEVILVDAESSEGLMRVERRLLSL